MWPLHPWDPDSRPWPWSEGPGGTDPQGGVKRGCTRGTENRTMMSLALWTNTIHLWAGQESGSHFEKRRGHIHLSSVNWIRCYIKLLGGGNGPDPCSPGACLVVDKKSIKLITQCTHNYKFCLCAEKEKHSALWGHLTGTEFRLTSPPWGAVHTEVCRVCSGQPPKTAECGSRRSVWKPNVGKIAARSWRAGKLGWLGRHRRGTGGWRWRQ